MAKNEECKLGKFLAETLGCAGKKLRPEKRKAIMGAAVMEIEKRGFQSASMDRIALKARVSKRTVYNHFGSKENLIKAIIHERIGQAKEAVSLEYDAAKPLREQLLELGRQEVVFIRETVSEDMTRAILSECIRNPDLAARIFEGLRDTEAGVPAWVRAAAADGKLNTDHPEFAAEQFMSLLKGILFWPPLTGWTTEPDDEAAEHTLTEAVEMFLARYGS